MRLIRKLRHTVIILMMMPDILLMCSSCMNDDNTSPVQHYQNELCHLDSLGTATFYPLPSIQGALIEHERLMDGRILISGDSLLVFDPPQNTITRIAKIERDFFNTQPLADLSPDGNYCVFISNNTILRCDLRNLNLETILHSSSPNNIFLRPTLSLGGRYLGYVKTRAQKLGWVDLLLGSNTELTISSYQAVDQAWLNSDGIGIYHVIGQQLKWMDTQGGNSNMIKDGLDWSRLSYDGRFLVCTYTSLYRQIMYRDNLSMTWYNGPTVGRFRMCRSANLIYYVSGNKLWKIDLEAGTETKILDGFVGGKQISGIKQIAPSWDGKDIYLTFYRPAESSGSERHPLKITGVAVDKS